MFPKSEGILEESYRKT